MPSPNPIPRSSRRPPLRADEACTVVMTAGLLWAVTGEFTTPAPGRTPAFIACDIRLVNDDGSESAPMQDLFAKAFIEQIEELAAESLAEDPRVAA
ncbi:hypothetical protein UB46_34630 [Burkholderiaceae bacterium 16]|nr:hypothetical protein UB46_34630 [Burkholderiaceae bacterium 16]